MNSREALDKIHDIRKDHKNDGFDVPAIRVDSETYKGLLKHPGLIYDTRGLEELNIDFEFDESVALVTGVEIIPDSQISEPVAEDVRMVESGRK